MTDDHRPTPNLGERPTVLEQLPELSKVLYQITQQLEDDRRAREAMIESSIRFEAKFDSHAASIDERFTKIEKAVFGDSGRPPPNPDDPNAPSPPLDLLAFQSRELAKQADTRASNAAQDVAALEGRMIAGFAAVKAEMKDNSNRLDRANTELLKQSKAMGIGVRGVRWAATSEGRQTLISIAVTIALAWAAARGSLVETAIRDSSQPAAAATRLP